MLRLGQDFYKVYAQNYPVPYHLSCKALQLQTGHLVVELFPAEFIISKTQLCKKLHETAEQ